MKKLLALLLTGFTIFSGFVFFNREKPEIYNYQDNSEREGTAIIMTGAAARIPQEAALLEELYRRGKLNDVVFISGVSSGALNAVMLNGILSGNMTWVEYKKILFSLKNSDIYIQNGKKLPVDTKPARELYTAVVEDRLGYHKIGDLPYMTAISFTNLKDLFLKKRVYRMCSQKINEESDTTLSLVDIMMASSAFPVAFPPVRIKNASTIPDVEYIDGGVGDDHVPFHALFEFERFRGKGVERVYIISRKSDSIPEVGEELANLGIKDRKIFDRLGISLENILKKDIIRRLEDYEKEAPELCQRTYIWIPDFKKDFFLMNFNNLQDQYTTTQQWARTHNPVTLEEYLQPFKKEERNLRSSLLRPIPGKQ
ncbi:MAG: patatin-like phospholipase family protein [Bacteroidia bacterium]|nr:patatin-like phospholipase family protein [Bacteroidia bacterium]